MMKRWLAVLSASSILSVSIASAQTAGFKKNFNLFKEVAPGIDFYARSRSDIAAFEKPVREVREKLALLMDRKLVRGAIVVCSTLDQKDSVQEKSLLKLGYGWALIQLTPEATAQQRIAEIKARMGNMLPPEVLNRLQNRTAEQKASDDARMIAPMMQKLSFAVVSTTLDAEREYKSSRLDDLSRSPIPDWLDLGIAWYATGVGLNMRYLQDRIEEAFPLEDVLSMPRPFVAPPDTGGGGGQTVIRMASAGGPNGAGAGSGQLNAAPPQGAVMFGGASQGQGGGGRRDGGRGSGGSGRGDISQFMSLPKDMQDRMIFDAQAASFFSYTLQKLGIEKAKEIVKESIAGKSTREILSRPGFLGPDMEKIETAWLEWVKAQKVDAPAMNRVIVAPGKTPSPPH